MSFVNDAGGELIVGVQDNPLNQSPYSSGKQFSLLSFKWFERGGLQFQVQFINKEYIFGNIGYLNK